MIWAIGIFILILFVFLFPILLGRPDRELEEVQRSFSIREAQLKRDFQFQTKELKRRLNSGDLADDEWQELNDELTKDTAQSLSGTETDSKSGINKTMPLAFVSIVIIIVAVGYITYHFIGFYDQSQTRQEIINVVKNSSQAVDEYRKNAQEKRTQEALTEFYSALRVQVDIEPENFQHWRELSYFNANSGRTKEAKAALRIAKSIAPDNLDLLVDEAQMLTISGETPDIIEGHRLISEVLKRDPNHQGALLVKANSAYRIGMYDLAIQSWQQLLSNTDSSSPMYSALQSRITEAQQQRDGRGPAPSAGHSTGKIPAKPAADKKPEPKVYSKDTIRVVVTLAEDMYSGLTGNETVFVFARAVNGPQFPLAAVRTTVAALDTEITLSDDQSMQAQFALSKFDEVRIVARISRSGTPSATTGDIEGQSEIIKKPFQTNVVTLVLDKVVE